MLTFWREVDCVPAVLNVIDAMTGTRRQNAQFPMQNKNKTIFWDSGSVFFILLVETWKIYWENIEYWKR